MQFLVISALLVIPAGMFAQPNTPVDVFPLTVGNTWSFDHESWNWFLDGIGARTITDTGTVTCTIRSRTETTDSTNWLVEQVSNLRGCVRDYPTGWETCYTVTRTDTFTLTEQHVDDHPLYCNYPAWPINFVFPFLRDLPDSGAARRFALVDSAGMFRLNTATPDQLYGFSFDFLESVGQISMRCSTIVSTGFAFRSSNVLRSYIIVSVAEQEASDNPAEPTLDQNFPNPFNSTTNIAFSIPSAQFIVLKVFNILGQEVEVLCNDVRSPGRHNISLNAGHLSSGTYIYRLQTKESTLTKKLILLR